MFWRFSLISCIIWVFIPHGVKAIAVFQEEFTEINGEIGDSIDRHDGQHVGVIPSLIHRLLFLPIQLRLPQRQINSGCVIGLDAGPGECS